MLREIGGEHGLTTGYIVSVLDAIYVQGLWVDTAISYLFDLKNGDIYVYYFHQFGDVFKINVDQKMAEIEVSSHFTDSVFSAPLGDEDTFTSRTYFFHELFYPKTRKKARSEIQKYERQYYVCMGVGVVIGTVILSGISLFVHRKVKKSWERPSLYEKAS